MKIDTKKLTGEALFYYFTHDHPNKEYADLVNMLPYAMGDLNKAIVTFEKLHKEGRVLYACYPPKDTPPSKNHILGSIPDGVLCYK